MKIVVIQEEIIQTDITPKELTKRWKKLEQLPGIVRLSLKFLPIIPI